jgi:hypothetical protein
MVGAIMNRYKQVKISVPADAADAFKGACATRNISMASVMLQFMGEYSSIEIEKNKQFPDYTSKRLRRKAIKLIIQQLEKIKAAEELYRDNIPENLQGSVVFDSAEEAVSLLEECVELLCSF